MLPYVDVISTNYNVDSPDGWMARYFFDGLRQFAPRTPVLISEWFFAAHENRSGNRNNGHLMTVPTQAERTRGAWRRHSDSPVSPRSSACTGFNIMITPRRAH